MNRKWEYSPNHPLPIEVRSSGPKSLPDRRILSAAAQATTVVERRKHYHAQKVIVANFGNLCQASAIWPGQDLPFAIFADTEQKAYEILCEQLYKRHVDFDEEDVIWIEITTQ